MRDAMAVEERLIKLEMRQEALIASMQGLLDIQTDFELPLYQKIRAIRIVSILLDREHGLVVVAGDRGGYVVCLKPHGSRVRCRRQSSVAGPLVRSDPMDPGQATS
jgi:hypothetical protein